MLTAVKLALHYMHKNKDDNSASRGSVIITASSAGLYPFPVAPLYGTSKAGIINLARSLGPAFEKSNIQVNALAPVVLGTSDVEEPTLRRHFVDFFAYMPHRNKHCAKQRPLQVHGYHPNVNLDKGR